MSKKKVVTNEFDETLTEHLADTYEQQGVPCPEVDIYTKFQELYDGYEPRNRVSLEETHDIAKKYFYDFLEDPRVDPAILEELLSPIDRIIFSADFYDMRKHLVAVNEALKELTPDEVDENWETLINAGNLTPDDLFRHNNWAPDSVTSILELIEKNVSADLIFKRSEPTLKSWADDGKGREILVVFTALKEHGLGSLRISSFIKNNADGDLIDDIVENPKPWVRIGIDPSDFFDAYIEDNGVSILSDPVRFAEHKSIDEITRILNAMMPADIIDAAREGYTNFVYFCQAVCQYADVNILEKKFFNRLSHDINAKNIEIAVALYVNGSNLVKGNELKSALTRVNIDENSALYYRDCIEIYESKR